MKQFLEWLQTAFDNLGDFLLRYLPSIILAALGVSVRIMIDNRAKRLSKWQIAIKVVISIFCGWVTFQALHSYGQVKLESWVPSLATIVGEGVIMWLMTNTNKIMTSLFKLKKNDTDIP